MEQVGADLTQLYVRVVLEGGKLVGGLCTLHRPSHCSTSQHKQQPPYTTVYNRVPIDWIHCRLNNTMHQQVQVSITNEIQRDNIAREKENQTLN